MREGHADGAIVLADALFLLQLRQIVEFSAQYRLPSMFYYHEAVKVGGLISYGQNHTETYRLAAAYVDKILKGAKPGELPVEQPTMILLAINRRTAKTLGLAVPQELLFRANEVID
jgi:putative ABC transport system substrate-binding protein